MIPITVPGFPGNDCRPLVLSRPNFVAAYICRRCETANINISFSSFIPATHVRFLRHRNPICRSTPARRDGAGCFSHRANMAGDELRKGQRRAVACVDLVYIGRKKKRRQVPSIAPYHPGSLRFHHLCSSSVTQLACMMSSDWKSYGVMSGSHC